MKLQEGDIIERNGLRYRVAHGGLLVLMGEPLLKRFDDNACEMTSGVRRALAEHTNHETVTSSI